MTKLADSIRKDYKICNIHRGRGNPRREATLYADLRDEDDTLLISATLDYITDRLYEMTTPDSPDEESRDGK